MEHLEILFSSLKDARRALLQRQWERFYEIVEVVDTIDTDILKAELSNKDRIYIDNILDSLQELLAIFGNGKVIINNERLMLAITLISAKVTDTITIIKELQARWEKLHAYPKELWEIFFGDTPDKKKEALKNFIEENENNNVSVIAKNLKSVATLPQRGHKRIRELLGIYLLQLISKDKNKDHSINNIWNNNL